MATLDFITTGRDWQDTISRELNNLAVGDPVRSGLRDALRGAFQAIEVGSRLDQSLAAHVLVDDATGSVTLSVAAGVPVPTVANEVWQPEPPSPQELARNFNQQADALASAAVEAQKHGDVVQAAKLQKQGADLRAKAGTAFTDSQPAVYVYESKVTDDSVGLAQLTDDERAAVLQARAKAREPKGPAPLPEGTAEAVAAAALDAQKHAEQLVAAGLPDEAA